jgi:hypothetical protein
LIQDTGPFRAMRWWENRALLKTLETRLRSV